MLNVAHVKNDVKWRPIVSKFGTLIENMSRRGCMTTTFFQILFDDFMTNSNFGIGGVHVKSRQPRWLSGLMRSRVHSLWLLVDQCVLRNWDRILVRAVKGLISRAGMVLICPLLWQRDVKTPTNKHVKSQILTYFFLCRHFSTRSSFYCFIE